MSGSNFNETTNFPVTKDTNGDVIIPNDLSVGGEVIAGGNVLERIANNQKDIFSASDIDVPLVSTLLYVGKAPLIPLTRSFTTPDLGTLRVLFVNRGNNFILWNDPNNALFNMENGNVADFPGVAGDVFNTPDATVNDFGVNLDFRLDLAMDSWVAANNNCMGKGNNSYFFGTQGTGLLRLGGGTASGNFVVNASAPLTFADGSRHWIRVTRVASTGVITFYTSEDGINWDVVGTPQPSALEPLNNTTQSLAIGSFNTSDTNPLEGKVFRMLLKDVIDGPTVVDFNPSDYSGIGSTFTSINTDEVWTFNGDVSIVGEDGYLGFDILDCIAVDNTNASTLFDIRASHVSQSPIGLVIMLLERVAFVAWANVGTIRDAGIVDIDTVLISTYLNSGLKLINVLNTIFTDTQWISPVPGKTAMEISGLVTQHDYRSTVSELASGTAIFRIDPAIPDDARIQITGTNAGPGNLLFDKRGPLGVAAVEDDFTIAADANIVSQSITGVSAGTPRSGGNVARFAHAEIVSGNGPLAVFQQVEITGYSGSFASYNGIFIITAIDTVSNLWFEVFSVISVGDDANGLFLSNATVITSDSSTDLLEGLGIIVDTDDSSMYDGGTYMYNVSGATFQINREFNESKSGSWTSAGIDHTDPRILAFANPDFADSKYIVCGFVNNNAATMDSVLTQGQFNPYNFTTGAGATAFTVSSNTERWKLVDQATATFIYLGNEPYDGNISFSVTLTKGTGSVTIYTLAMSKSTDGGSSFSPLEALTTIQVSNSETKSASLVISLSVEKGDLIRPELNPDSENDVIANFFSMYGVG